MLTAASSREPPDAICCRNLRPKRCSRFRLPATPPHAPPCHGVNRHLPGGRYLALPLQTDAVTHGAARARLLPASGPAGAGAVWTTRSVREAWATPGTANSAVTVRTGQLPRLFGVSAQDVMEEFVPLDTLWPRRPGQLGTTLRQAGTLAACRHARWKPALCTQAARHMQRSRTWCCRRFVLTGSLAKLAEHCQLGCARSSVAFLRLRPKACASFVSNGVCSQLLASQVLACRPPASHGLADIAGWRVFDAPSAVTTCMRFTGFTARRNWPASWPSRIRRCGPYRFNSMDARQVLRNE